MTNKDVTKPPIWFWIVSVLALLWNLIGVSQYLGQAFMTDEAKALLPAAELQLIEETPTWITAAFAVAVWFGLVACIGLLIRKKWAKNLFLISLIAVIIQMGYSTLMTSAIDLFGSVAIIMPALVTIIAALLYYFSSMAAKKNWLR